MRFTVTDVNLTGQAPAPSPGATGQAGPEHPARLLRKALASGQEL